MKPFSLVTVLKHRKILEDQAIQRLVQAREEEKSARHQLNEHQEVLATLIKTLTEEQASGIEVVRLARFEQRINLIETQILSLEAVVREKQKKVTQAQNYLITRSKERKIMETLQQKQDGAWRQSLTHKENSTLDEIAVIFHNRE